MHFRFRYKYHNSFVMVIYPYKNKLNINIFINTNKIQLLFNLYYFKLNFYFDNFGKSICTESKRFIKYQGQRIDPFFFFII